MTLSGVCAAAVWLAAAHGQAQQVSLRENAGDAEHPRGHYNGVKPGGDELPATPAKPGSSPAITWPGFQMQPDGSSRVFVQTTTRVDVRTVSRGDKLIVDFGNVSIDGHNNRLPLYTKFFNTPVTEIALKRANKRTVMEMTMRSPAEPHVSTEQAKSGFYFVYFDFPPGSYLQGTQPANPETAAIPPPNPPAPGGNPATKEAPSALDASGEVKASGSVNANADANVNASAGADAELPPGMGKAKAKAKAGGKAKASGKIGF